MIHRSFYAILDRAFLLGTILETDEVTSLDITIPLSSTRASYDPERAQARYQMNSELIADRYKYEKFIGKRKKDGALKLKELKPEHKQWVACYINGMKGVEIAEQYEVAAITVYRVLADPLATSLIGEFDEAFKNEFRALFPLVSDVVRSSLASDNEGVRLKAVDRWTKIVRFIDGDHEYENKSHGTEAIFAARLKFVDMIKRATANSTLIEAEVVTVVKESS